MSRSGAVRAATINRSAVIGAAKINRTAAMTAVIISAFVAVSASGITAFIASNVATRQIASADSRSKAEFLTKQREIAYSEFIASVDDVLSKAPAVAALFSSGTSNAISVYETQAWNELKSAFEEMGQTSVKVNLTGSDDVCAITDQISVATNSLYISVAYSHDLDREVIDEILHMKLDFGKVARADITGQR